MKNVQIFDDEGTAALTDGEIRAVARRQLAGSVVVAVIIAVVATLIAVKPAHRDFAETSSQKIATVQQPSFVAPSGQRLAAVQHAIELP